MSTIIRDAIIRLKLEQAKGKIEAPDTSAITRAYEAETKAAKEAKKAVDESNTSGRTFSATAKDAAKSADTWAAGLRKVNEEWKKSGSGRDSFGEGMARMKAAAAAEKTAAREKAQAASDAARAQVEFGRATQVSADDMVRSFREGGEGALRMARGIAFLSASGSESLQKLVQKVALAQGAFDVFAGSAKLISNLGAVFGGPVAIGVGVATAAIAGGVAIWGHWKQAAEDAAKAQEQVRQAAIEFEQQQQSAWERQQQREGQRRSGRATGAGLATEFALTPEDKLAAIGREEQGLAQEMKLAEKQRNQRLRGFRAGDFGGDESEAFRSLLKFGSSSQLTNARDFEEQRSDVARRQLEIDKLQYEAEKKRLEEAGQSQQQQFSIAIGAAFIPGSNFGGVGLSAGIGAVAGTFAEDTKKQLADLLAAQKAANAEMIAAFDDAQRKLSDLRKALELASPQ